jgi:aldose 1-epimerase
MKEVKDFFGYTSKGAEVFKYTLENDNGMTVSAIDLGAVITNIIVKDRDGVDTDVVLGYDDVRGYEVNGPSFGAIVGRCANRIGNHAFTINGSTYKLEANNGTNNLHGGHERFNHKMYRAVFGEEDGNAFVKFHRVSPYGEQNLPGNFSYTVKYTLTNDNELFITYDGTTDEDTVVNLTNHSYFNITKGGESGDAVYGLKVKIDADRYTPLGDDACPTGELADVSGTPFDFREYKTIIQDFDAGSDFLGYDHNFHLNNDHRFAEAARCHSDESGITMIVSTDMPDMQLYTAATLSDSGKHHGQYNGSQAVCFETQFVPNAVNLSNPEIDSPILKAGDKYHHVTSYRFTVE